MLATLPGLTGRLTVNGLCSRPRGKASSTSMSSPLRAASLVVSRRIRPSISTRPSHGMASRSTSAPGGRRLPDLEDAGGRRRCGPDHSQSRSCGRRVFRWQQSLLPCGFDCWPPCGVCRCLREIRSRFSMGWSGSTSACSTKVPTTSIGSAGETRLQYLDFGTAKSSTVARNLGDVLAGLTASPDGRTILYTRVDASVDDLMLVENFR